MLILILLCFTGVDGVEIDAKNHKVTVKGEKADPIKVTERLRKKSGKHVELISPKPEKQEKKEEEKPEVNSIFFFLIFHIYYCASLKIDEMLELVALLFYLNFN